MKHVAEDDLILLHYGEAEDRESIEAHLESCSDCRAGYAELRATLAMADRDGVPEPPPSYGRDVWASVEPRLERAPAGWRSWLGFKPVRLTPARLGLAATVAVLLVVAFLAGRHSGPRTEPGPISEQVRERILLVAVGDHLERSRRLLIELSNTDPEAADTLQIERHRVRAEGLVPQNRLYRTTAAQHGDRTVESVLEELERLLLEIAHGDDDGGDRLAALQQRIERNGILLKIRVLGDRARDAEARPGGAGRQKT
jgi:hypothetical protein